MIYEISIVVCKSSDSLGNLTCSTLLTHFLFSSLRDKTQPKSTHSYENGLNLSSLLSNKQLQEKIDKVLCFNYMPKTNLQSTVSPSISLREIEDKYPGLSTQTVLNVWSSMQHDELVSSDLPNRTKVTVLFRTLIHSSQQMYVEGRTIRQILFNIF